MKEIKKWVCDYCGTEYEKASECSECERRHVEASEYTPIYESSFSYPKRIRVKMDDGITVNYYRN